MSGEETRSKWALTHFKVVDDKYECQLEIGLGRSIDGNSSRKICSKAYSVHKTTNLIYHLRHEHANDRLLMNELATFDKAVADKAVKRVADSKPVQPPSKRVKLSQPSISSVFTPDNSVIIRARDDLSS
jgi:BED zinc finger